MLANRPLGLYYLSSFICKPLGGSLRDPDTTRQKLLDVSAEEMLQHGYTGASLSDILHKAGISKGALYHHFPNKQELGYAVFAEVFIPMYIEPWHRAAEHQDPIAGFCEHLDSMVECLSANQLVCGCPVNNISQEMSATDEGFRKRSLVVYERLQSVFEKALAKADQSGLLKSGIKYDETALFMVSILQGIASVVKTSQEREVLHKLASSLKGYLNSLRR